MHIPFLVGSMVVTISLGLAAAMAASTPAPTTQPGEALQPFWKTRRMAGETVLFLEPVPGKLAEGSLMFVPTRILSVTSSRGDATYEAGKDYTWTPGTRTLTRTHDSRMPMMTQALVYPPKHSQKFGTCRDRNVDLLYVEGPEFLDADVVVTYDHAPPQEIGPTLSGRASLADFMHKISQKRPVSVVLLGDSISVGCNASGVCKVPPFQPGYGELSAQYLRDRFGADVTFKNLSVAGQTSGWAMQQVPAVVKENPDLVILAFGMNDASGGVDPKTLVDNLEKTMVGIRAGKADCQFVLVTPMTGNPEWTGTNTALYPKYRDALVKLHGASIAVADVTSPWLALLAKKKYLDLTGNGLNHPNDFGYRVYAQAVCALFEP